MTSFAVNLSLVFRNLPFIDRFDAARRAGFDTVELWWPTATELDGLSLDEVAKHIQASGLTVTLLNFAAGDPMAGDRGLAGEPDRVEQFRANVPAALELAGRLGCRKLNALAGRAQSRHERSDQLDVLAESLALAADAAEPRGVTVLLESLNQIDNPGYLLAGPNDVLQMIERVGRPNIGYLVDSYHVVAGGHDLLATVALAEGLIGHVQLADAPRRDEPGSGEIDFPSFLRAVRSAGYHDIIGLEYIPTNPDAPDFAYLESLADGL